VSLSRIEKRIRLAAAIIAAALLIEIAGLLWSHPLSFALLHMLALTLFIIGAATYLLALLPADQSRPVQEGAPEHKRA
jgi:hypothetical protein